MMPDPRLGLAQKYALSGLHDDAWAILQGLLAEDASLAALQLAASIQVARNMFVEAKDFADRAVHIDPSHHETTFNLGLSWEKLGDNARARDFYQKALTLNNSHDVTWNNLGGVLEQLGRIAEAIEAYETAVAINPMYDAAYNNLGVVLMGQGRFAAAQRAFQRALSCNANNVAALINLGVAEVEFGEVASGLRRFDDALELAPTNVDACDNRLFSSHYNLDDPQALAALHMQLERRSARCLAPTTENLDPTRKLRVGYVSPDFRRHSVASFIEGLLRDHDRNMVEVFCYSNAPSVDDVTVRLQNYANHWRSITGLSAVDARDLIQKDRVDILVDLAGHTVGNRLDIFASCAAPIQVTGIGYPNTSGLLQINARFADYLTDPSPDADRWATERILRLKPALHCYTPPEIAPAVGPLPALTRGYMTFGSFNKRAKISDETIQLWSAVLNAVPLSRLLIKAKALTESEAQEHLASQFVSRGIARSRLQFFGWQPEDKDHLAMYSEVDIGLDTYPYNGTTTTCEALWMGVPVLTRIGRAHAARVGASLLTALNFREHICADTNTFVASAVHLASNTSVLSQLRTSLRERMKSSPLCQPREYARTIEAEYRWLWHNYCASTKA
jgi:predicted O-linked N-acetylglucosamine transferase (SPINDLY family)